MQDRSAVTGKVRAAREDLATGQYEVMAESATLTIDRATVTLAVDQPAGTTLLHLPLPHLFFGRLDAKMMAVPASRGACWLVEFHEASCADVFCQYLASFGIHVAKQDAGRTPCVSSACAMSASDLDMELEKLYDCEDFLAHLASVEAALDRRQALGLPDLLGSQKQVNTHCQK